MGVFNNLHDVAQVLTEHIRDATGIADVQPGDPRDVAATTVAAARLTLLYATPQPGHRNDPIEVQPDSTRRAPPLSLSCYYVVTTSGADSDDPIAAHGALGDIMALYHDQPVLDLPLSDDPNATPGAFTDLGEGRLHVVQAPMQADQVDKIWTTLDQSLQPWVMFEVSPVQLVSSRPDLGPAQLVRPGGIGLEVRAGTRPLILRVTPEVVRPTGAVRIDAVVPGDPEHVSIDGAAVPVGPELVVGDGALRLDLTALPAPPAPGARRLALTASGLVSRQGVLRVAEPAAAVVDAPALGHDPAVDLVLTGAELAGANACLCWPDGGLANPTDVHELAVSAVAADQVTVVAAELATLPAGRGPWRLVVRVGATVFTPYVVLELEP